MVFRVLVFAPNGVTVERVSVGTIVGTQVVRCRVLRIFESVTDERKREVDPGM